MKSRSSEIDGRSHFMRIAVAAILLLAGTTTISQAKSLYVIAQNLFLDRPLPLHAYDIGPDGRLTFQTEYGIQSVAGGAVGITIDSDSGSLFITYEFTNEIRVVDAVTMDEQLIALAPGATDLAGIVYDHDKGLLYAVDREEPNLYVYRWDAIRGQLNGVLGSPFELKGAEAYGIALDEIEDQLYVGGPSKQVLVYNTSDWSLVRTIPLHRTAISVAVDAKRRYLYTGGGYIGNWYLTQYNLSTGAETETLIAADAGVMGLAVDPATGFVYVTTGRDNMPGGDDLLVFDRTLRQIQAIEDIGSATGIVIPGKETSYNPLHLVKTVETTSGTVTPGMVQEIPLGREFTYSICFDHDGYALTDVVVTDTLPPEVIWVRGDFNGGPGEYNADKHTYTWRNPPLSMGPTTCLELVARLKPEVTAGTVVRNSVTIDTGQTPPTTFNMDAVAAEIAQPFSPLGGSKEALGGVTISGPGGTAYANAGDLVTYLICYNNEANTQAVTNVTITDTLPPGLIFEPDENPLVGYDEGTRTCTWSVPSLVGGGSGCVDLIVRVAGDIPTGTVITNSVLIDSDETDEATITAGPITAVVPQAFSPLGLSKAAVGGVDANDPTGIVYANAGGLVTYRISYDSGANTQTVTNVTIVDFLPPELVFEPDLNPSARYDERGLTCTWSFQSLAPGRPGSVDLVVRVAADTRAGAEITNSARITSDQTEPTDAEAHAITVVRPEGFRPLSLSKAAVPAAGADTPSGTVRPKAGDLVTYEICYGNEANTQAVTNITIVDSLPPQLIFEPTGNQSARYDDKGRTCTWSIPSLDSGRTGCVTLIVRVARETTGGTAITNRVRIQSDQTGPMDVNAVIVTADQSLQLTKRIKSGDYEDPKIRGRRLVNPGANLTYEICLANPSTREVTQVSIVDDLPWPVTFVSATGDPNGRFYDLRGHTYTRYYDSLGPDANDCWDLVVHVPQDIAPGTLISNLATVYAQETQSATATADVNTPDEPIDPLGDPVVCELLLKPTKLYRDLHKQPTNLMAVLHMPEGCGKQMIANQPLTLTPGDLSAPPLRIFGTTTAGAVMVFFDPDDLLAATTVNGYLTLTVTGQLTDGRSFQGQQDIQIFRSSEQ